MRKFIAFAGVVGITAGCYSNPDAFAKRASELTCELLDVCHLPCDEDLARESLEEAGEDCDYNPAAARACIRELRRAIREEDCDGHDENDACDDVYSDCDADPFLL